MSQSQQKAVFWDNKFKEVKTAWGHEPVDSAIYAKDIFQKENIRNILIPGIGFGRNAKIFTDKGIRVTGIEISKTAIDLAHNELMLDIPIHHGSVNDMPFDDQIYDGIYCYALIHLLNQSERKALIRNCYNQLASGGIMIFVVVSKNSGMYGSGKKLSKDRFKISNGLNVFFYDMNAAKKEFGEYGMIECRDFDEPIKHMKDEPPLKCLLITCRKY
jgi:SAM-dependent methyltransferase